MINSSGIGPIGQGSYKTIEQLKYTENTRPFNKNGTVYIDARFKFGKSDEVTEICVQIFGMHEAPHYVRGENDYKKPYGAYFDQVYIIDKEEFLENWNGYLDESKRLNKISCVGWDEDMSATRKAFGCIDGKVTIWNDYQPTTMECCPWGNNVSIDFLKTTGNYTFVVAGEKLCAIEWKDNWVSQVRYIYIKDTARISCMITDTVYKKIIIGLDTGKTCRIDWDFNPSLGAAAIEEIVHISSGITCLQTHSDMLFIGTYTGLFYYNTQNKSCKPLIENELITSLEWIGDTLFVGASKVDTEISKTWHTKSTEILWEQHTQQTASKPQSIESKVEIWRKGQREEVIPLNFIPTFIKAARAREACYIIVGNLFAVHVLSNREQVNNLHDRKSYHLSGKQTYHPPSRGRENRRY